MSKSSKPKMPSRDTHGHENMAYERLPPEPHGTSSENDQGEGNTPRLQKVTKLRVETDNAKKNFKNLIATRRLNRRITSGSAKSFDLRSAVLSPREGRHLGLDLETDEVEAPIPRNASNLSNGMKSAGKEDTSTTVIHALNRKVIEHFVVLAKNNNENDEVDLDHLQELFERGANINCSDKYGQTLLHEAARSWHTDVATFLVDKGIDVNKKDRYGRAALHVAAATDYPEMVEFLIEHGAEVEARTEGERQTPLHFAARNDAVESCKSLIKIGAEMEACDYRGRTPAHVAAELDRSETARWLVENGANVGVMDDSGQSCMTHMITKMGPVARDSLDTFHKTDRANRKQYFYLNLLENDISDDDGGEAGKKGFGGSLAKTPLQVIVSYKQLDIIMHPVILRMLELKWNRFGRIGAIQSLLINLLFILLWTVLAVGVSWQTRYQYNFPTDAWIIVIWIGAFGLTLYYVVLECWEIVSSRNQFKKWKAWKEKLIDEDLAYSHPKWPEEAAYLHREKETLDDMLPAYFHDFWNYFDWTVYFLNFAVLITHIADVLAYTDETRPPPCCGEDGCDATAALIRNGNITVKSSCNTGSVNNASLSVWNNRIFVLNIIMLWLRLMKNMRAFRMLGPFVVMLGKIVYDVIRFLFLYFEFYIPYACAFWMIFGDEISITSMFTVDKMLFSLYRITLVDDYQFDEMQAFDIVMAYILIGTFLGISAILCINLFIALLSDTFQRVYDNAKANAFMQQAILILSVEDNLPQRRKDRFRKYIRETCSPLKEYYDDDLTTLQDDNLKKVTFQIKDQMDELIERLEVTEKHEALLGQLHNADGGKSPLPLGKKDSYSSYRQSPRPLGLLSSRGSSGALVAYEGLSRMSTDIALISSTVQKMQRRNEKVQNRMRSELFEIKSLLLQVLTQAEEKKVKRSRSRKRASVVDSPIFPVEVTTLPPVRSVEGRSHTYDDLRTEHPASDRGPSPNADLMRRLIRSSEEHRRRSESPKQGEEFELIMLPGTTDSPAPSARVDAEDSQVGDRNDPSTSQGDDVRVQISGADDHASSNA